MASAVLVHARAPIRICDLGAWTDTWFAGRGRVLNIAVEPGVEVEMRAEKVRSGTHDRVVLRAENYGLTFRMDPDYPRPEPHGLLQFAVAVLPPVRTTALDIRIHSRVPAGISTGTSAAVCVALLGALNALKARPLGWADLARLAHRVETDKLGQQSGIQDQIAAAHGGISFIAMARYPDARTTFVRVPADARAELERRLCLVYLGSPHRSSSIHERVIAELEAGGPQREVLARLERAAVDGRNALRRGDWASFGAAMIRNNEEQRALAAGLIPASADAVAAVARRFGATGWKVNGAGGEGGSMAILASADDGRRRAMIAAIDGFGAGIRVIPTTLAGRGVHAWAVPAVISKA